MGCPDAAPQGRPRSWPREASSAIRPLAIAQSQRLRAGAQGLPLRFITLQLARRGGQGFGPGWYSITAAWASSICSRADWSRARATATDGTSSDRLKQQAAGADNGPTPRRAATEP